jgi:excisionase family DNA binding protein
MLLRMKRVAEELSVSRSHAYRLVSGGVIPSVRIGASLRVPSDALHRWIREHTTSTGGLELPTMDES